MAAFSTLPNNRYRVSASKEHNVQQLSLPRNSCYPDDMDAPTQMFLSPRLPLAIVVAMTRDHLIGASGHLPWNIPEDLNLFRRLTLNGTVIMGRRTFATIGQPLAQRTNIVLSQSTKQIKGCFVAGSLLHALKMAMRIGRPTFFIGGATVYRQVLPIVDTLHISWIDGNYTGDLTFPDFDLNSWTAVSGQTYQRFQYVRYKRAEPSAQPNGSSQHNPRSGETVVSRDID